MSRCPHCGYEADETRHTCPLCGAELDGDPGRTEGERGTPARPADSSRSEPGAAGPAGTGSSGAAAGASSSPAPGAGVDWERPDASFPAALFAAWKQSVFEPSSFFAALRPGGPLARGILYYLILAVVGAFLTAFWEASMGFEGASYLGRFGMGRMGLTLFSFFVAPFLALVGLLISTLVVQAMLAVLAPDRRPMSDTARVVCYSAGPQVFQIVPIIGSLVAGVWSLVLMVIGVREMHRISTGRAAAAVLLPLVLLTGFLMVLIAVTLVAVGTGVEGLFNL